MTAGRTIATRTRRFARWSAIVVLALATSARADLAPGGTLGAENWEAARGLLPDEFLETYRRGDYRHPIGEWRPVDLEEDPVFAEALRSNAEKLDLSEDGSIIERATGKPPGRIFAWPFPKIDATDPKAATKIVWNYFYTHYYGGNGHYRADLMWINRKGLDRAINIDAYHKYYEGQHPRFQEKGGPDDLLSQSFSEVRAPADVSGTLSLAWRFRSAKKRDSIWTFVPALRRMRQVSPANRSDGFLGSDMSQDDGPYFDGKVEDFTWRLVGEGDLLVLFDRPSFTEPADLERLPGGGWRMIVPGGARVGFQVPEWKGVAWCPVQQILIRRPHWIVEGVPKDPYYLYGKLVLRFDKDIYLGSYSSKYDWKGKLLTSYSAIRTNLIRVGPGEYWGWIGGAVAVATNWKLDRATTAGLVAGENVPADSRIPLSPDLFSLQRLTSQGR
jgi:hypothetical protein